jgi:hypothetical protein
MDSSSLRHVTLVDCHVHHYGCFSTESFFASAFANFAAEASRRNYGSFASAILLAETSRERWFEEMSRLAAGKEGGTPDLPRLSLTGEEESLAARGPQGEILVVIAGSQIVTAERLEILALCTKKEFSDGFPALQTLEEIRGSGGLPVLPWGAGKWWGVRGRIAGDLLEDRRLQPLWCGDTGVRPALWQRPALFRKAETGGAGILSGSDPLPLPGDERRVGSYGIVLPFALSGQTPARDLRNYLMRENPPVEPFGKAASPSRFLGLQLRLRWSRRKGKRTG